MTTPGTGTQSQQGRAIDTHPPGPCGGPHAVPTGPRGDTWERALLGTLAPRALCSRLTLGFPGKGMKTARVRLPFASGPTGTPRSCPAPRLHRRVPQERDSANERETERRAGGAAAATTCVRGARRAGRRGTRVPTHHAHGRVTAPRPDPDASAEENATPSASRTAGKETRGRARAVWPRVTPRARPGRHWRTCLHWPVQGHT